MTVGVVGLGLIGGSIGLALRDPSRSVVGCDSNADHCRIAKDRFLVDEIVPLEAVAKADIVFVATPPSAVPALLAQLFDAKGQNTVISDCASVKGPIMTWVEANAPTERCFVGGHPMAGHEKSGPAFASAWLFRGAKWLISPAKASSTTALRTVERVVKDLGATPVRIAAEEHDRHVAVLSHVPHILAGALVTAAKDLGTFDASGGSWKDLTRVGGVDPGLWTDIIMQNSEQVSIALEQVVGMIGNVQSALAKGDIEAVRSFFEEAKRAKK